MKDGVDAAPASPGPAQASRQVLIVDDSATMRCIVRKVLEASHFPVDLAEAQDGAAAIEQINSGKFDLIFLDYNMPGLNGIDTLVQIKGKFPQLDVVVMTSHEDDTVAKRAHAAGAVAFLPKPFYPKDIDAVVQGLKGGARPGAPSET
ncbi:MAG: response regulator [Xanthobacteraceae bacterium]